MSAVQVLDAMLFLSTPSARRATVVNDFTELPIFDFYPRPPRGGRLVWERLTAPDL